ncbi:MAG: dihydroneopterin aldolase [Alphaproteobacteria bacterium]
MDFRNKIFIQDLTIKMNVGILPREQGRKSPVIFNAEITLDPARRWGKDQISETVPYDGVVEIIKQVSAGRHFNLLEVLLEDIASELLADNRIISVTISAAKPRIIRDAARLGVEITRSR